MSSDTSGGGIGRQRRRQAGFRATQIGVYHQPVRDWRQSSVGVQPGPEVSWTRLPEPRALAQETGSD